MVTLLTIVRILIAINIIRTLKKDYFSQLKISESYFIVSFVVFKNDLLTAEAKKKQLYSCFCVILSIDCHKFIRTSYR